MKKQVVIVCVLLLTFLSTNLFAQEEERVEELDEIVITATKFKLKKENTGKVIYKISQQDIQNNAGKTVIELLNNIPGIEIRGVNSNPSEPRGTFVRGGRGRQVLVLIDGVPVSDPSGINQEYDLRLLSLNQVENIEILKGASSTLYGTGAATGVINITLKKSSKKQVTGTYEVSMGTNNTSNKKDFDLVDRNQNASIRGTLDKFNFLGSFNLTGINGMSAAKSQTDETFETDAYYTKNGLLKLGYTISDRFSVETFLNFDEYTYEYDSGIYSDNTINNGEQSQIRVGIRPKFVYNSGEVYLIASFNDVERKDENFSSFSNSVNKSVFEGQSINLDLANKYNFYNGNLQLITGINYQEHSNNTTSPFSDIDKDLANFNIIDPYASLVYISDFGLSINVGGRLNMHSNYGNHFVYDTNIAYTILKNNEIFVKGLASYSSAFIAPSTYQLFSAFGNTALDPESSNTFEVGFEASCKNIIELNAVYFNRNEKNAIIFQSLDVSPWGVYANSGETNTISGIEVETTIQPIDKLRLNLGYTYTDKEKDIDYIPKHKLFANVELNPLKNTFISFVYKNVGERLARFYDPTIFETVEQTLPKYNLFDINANYKLLDGAITVFGSVSNLLNEDYEDILGYSTRGRNFKLGLRLKL